MAQPIIIVGTGLAGYQLAREFRKLDQTSPLILITADDGKYYSKPQLSTALSSGKTAEMLPNATREQMAEQLQADIRANTSVTSIDPNAKTISIDHETLAYAKLVLACGADVIRPTIPGDATDCILSINHIYHYAQFRDLIQNKKQIAILGAGLIGCEFANDLSNAGYHVDIIAPVPAPLDLLVPPKIGQALQTALEKIGVHFHLPSTASEVHHIENDRYRMTLSNGETIETDFILSAIGLRPHTALAKTANLQINHGILVNRYLATSVADIYALGDCAEVEGHVLPYITPLLNCSRALAKTLAGTPTAVEYPAMPVVVKTPAHPLVVCPPPKKAAGTWQLEETDTHIRALFYDDNHQLLGFVLTNDAVKDRAALAKQLPHLF